MTRDSNENRSNVIPLPLKKKRKVYFHQEMKKTVLVLSLFSIVATVIFTNELIQNKQRPVYIITDNENQQSQSRFVASVPGSQKSQALWMEQQVAKDLADFKDSAVLGKKAHLLDELSFETLQSQYSLRVKSGRVTDVDFMPTKDGDQPVYLKESKENFLQKYKDLFPVPFNEVRKKGQQGKHEVFQLYADGKLMAEAQMDFDEKGRLLHLSLTPEFSDK